MTTPYWVQDSIFYHIFPDRFANGDTANDPANIQKWGSPPTTWGFQGGDLRGIIQNLDYLLELGVNALYLNPIFLATSNHRYNTSDYFQIDPRVGTLADFHALVDSVHKNDMRIILDGVFNHCGRGFFAFLDVLENGDKSAYKDWFYIKQFPLDAFDGSGEAQNYVGWWNHKSLPKLNTGNPNVRKYILSVARYWIEQGSDGWRLDVPNEIDDDGFWEEFRHVVKSANRDAYLAGEIWEVNSRWANNTHFDGLLNYPVKDALAAFLQGRENAVQFSQRIDNIVKAYPRKTFSPCLSHWIAMTRSDLRHWWEGTPGNLSWPFCSRWPSREHLPFIMETRSAWREEKIPTAGAPSPGVRAPGIWNCVNGFACLSRCVKGLLL